MENNQTQIWKQAVDIYADVSELSIDDAIAHINNINNLSFELKQAVFTLVNSGNQASVYIQDRFTPQASDYSVTFPDYERGTRLGEYELLEKLGQGGMSQVFKAKRLDSEAQKMVAIKIFAPKHHSQLLLDRFVTEQQILSGFSHPNIVDMLHGGKTDNNTAYLVMELIDNALTLDKYSAKENLSVKQNIAIIEQCANALAYSHANLIIHRDLKPDNILINGNNQVKIVDFGIAKLINNDVDGNNTTIMALTPNYAAPEQINSQAITVKTDVFSLAVVALDILCKAPPLPKDRLIKSCINDDEFINKNLKKVNCDKDLKNILRKALEQNPDNRYSSMQSFADDLNNWLSDKPVNATAPSIAYKIKKFAQRRTALFATLVSFFALLIIGSILGYQQYKQIKIEAHKALQVKQFMLDSFEITDPDTAKGVNISVVDLLELSRIKLQNNSSIEAETKFDLLQTLALAYGKIGQFKQSINLLNQSLKIQPKNNLSISYLCQYLLQSDKLEELNELLKGINITEFSSIANKARVLRVQIKLLFKSSRFSQAQSLINSIGNLNNDVHSIDSLRLRRLQAELYSYQSQNKKAIDILKNIVETTKLAKNNTLIIAIKSDLAKLYDEMGASELSIEHWNNVISSQKEILGDRHPSLANSLASLSAAYRHIGEFEKSLSNIEKAYQLSVQLNGKISLTSANMLNTRAMLLFDSGDTDKAIELLYDVVEIYTQQGSKDFLDTYVVKTNLATLLSQSGRTDESFKMIQDVYSHNLKTLGKHHYDTLSAQQLLARNLSTLGQQEKAIDMARSAILNAQMYIKESNNDILFGTYYTLGKIYQANKLYQAGIDNFLEILDKDVLNPNGLKYAILLHATAKIYHESGEFNNAEKFYIKSIENFLNLFGDTHARYLMAQIKYAQLLNLHNKNKKLNQLIKKLKKLTVEKNISTEIFLEALDALSATESSGLSG